MTSEQCKWASLMGAGAKRRLEDRTPYPIPVRWEIWSLGAVKINKVYGQRLPRECGEDKVAKCSKNTKQNKQKHKLGSPVKSEFQKNQINK